MTLYRGIVVNNKDPKKGSRVQVRIFDLHGIPLTFSESKYQTFSGTPEENNEIIKDDELPWAEVMQRIDYIGFFNTNSYDKSEKEKFVIDGAGSKEKKSREKRKSGDRIAGFGSNVILEVGTWVFVLLEQDDPNFPIVIGTVCSENEIHDFSKETNKRVYNSTSGHFEQWEDTKGKENIQFHHRTGTEIEFEPDGSLETQVVKNNKLYVMENNLEQIDKNQKIQVDENSHINVLKNSIYESGENTMITVHKNLVNRTDENNTFESGSNTIIKVGGNLTNTTEGSNMFKSGGTTTITNGGAKIILSGGNILLN